MYSCRICKTNPDQKSNHQSHVETQKQKHKDKQELFESNLSELEMSYNTANINDIVMEAETIIRQPIQSSPRKLKDKTAILSNVITNIATIEKTIEQTKMIEQSITVSNKEGLRDKIHEIHNFLRNHGAGYGMNALKVFNILYGLKKLEETHLIDKVNLKKPACEFSYLLRLANENKDEMLAELIFGEVLQSICDSELKELLFYEIPQNIRGSVFVYLLKEIDKITIIERTCNVLLSGKIYEYFIGRDESAISELGAYFTDRHLVEYILTKLSPTLNEDGSVPTMIDMFGGSGGFTTGYVNHINDKYPGINWAVELNKIFHYDMNEDVIKSAGLELFCLTGELPCMDNLRYKNSFTDEFNGRKYKYPLTNPPYGGDKTNKSEAQSKREKVTKFIKNELLTLTDESVRTRRQLQLNEIESQEKMEKKESDKSKVCVSSCSARIQKFAKEHNLTGGNDKEICSLILMMDIVESGGTSIGVLKEGVFFNENNTYRDLRRCLIENYNVREVISVPRDQFENTTTKTSIVIFDNIEQKTSEVLFSDLVVERYEEDKFSEISGDIVIVENKGDIVRVVDKPVSRATKNEILANSICSLNGKDYIRREIEVSEGYQLVKVGDICEFKPKSAKTHKGTHRLVKIKDIENNTIINYDEMEYSKVKETNICQHDDILISNVRPKSPKSIILTKPIIDRLDDISFTLPKLRVKPNDSVLGYQIPAMFVYAALYPFLDKFEIELCTGSQYPTFKIDRLQNYLIPIPRTQSKTQEWVDKLSKSYNEKNIDLFKQFVQELSKEAMPNQPTLPVAAESAPSAETPKKRATKAKKTVAAESVEPTPKKKATKAKKTVENPV